MSSKSNDRNSNATPSKLFSFFQPNPSPYSSYNAPSNEEDLDHELLLDETFHGIEDEDAYPLEYSHRHKGRNRTLSNGHGSRESANQTSLSSASLEVTVDNNPAKTSSSPNSPNPYHKTMSTTSLIEASLALLTRPVDDLAIAASGMKRRKSGIPPETEFLFSVMHCTSLEDAQEMARARYDYLRLNDDAARLHRLVPVSAVAFACCPKAFGPWLA